MKTYIDTVAYIHIQNKKLLLTRSKGKTAFYMPGGKRNQGEDDKQALVREIKEELGIEIEQSSIKFYKVFEAQAYGEPEGTLVRITSYTATHNGEIKPQAEIDKIRFSAADEYLNMPSTAPAARLIVADLREENVID